MSIEKVVVVEDDKIDRANYEAQLRQRRCDVLAVSNLAAAREALAKDTFDLVLLDVRLPMARRAPTCSRNSNSAPSGPWSSL